MRRHCIAASVLVATIGFGSAALAQPAAGPPGSATTPAEKLAPVKATHPAGSGGRVSHHGAKSGVAAHTGAGSKGGNLGATTSRSTGTTAPADPAPQ
jgi:hypothetical protein